MKNITNHVLDTVTGGFAALGTATASTGRRSSSSSSLQMQMALSNITSSLDSLKNNQKSSIEQLLPVALMARFIRQNG